MNHDSIILSNITTPDKALTEILSLIQRQLENVPKSRNDTQVVFSQIHDIIKYVKSL